MLFYYYLVVSIADSPAFISHFVACHEIGIRRGVNFVANYPETGAEFAKTPPAIWPVCRNVHDCEPTRGTSGVWPGNPGRFISELDECDCAKRFAAARTVDSRNPHGCRCRTP